MKFKIPNKLSQNIPSLMRRCGYMPIHDRRSGKDSFSRKLSGSHYPRFHMYIKETDQEIIFDLHLDQTSSRYNNQTAHNADYDSEEVKNELIRVYQLVKESLER
jgi:hypothetical protein